MGKILRLTESDLLNLVKRVIKENLNDVNNHRYETSPTEPGIEKFLNNPTDQIIKNGLNTQLERDKYGKGKIIIVFNNRRFDRPAEFLYFIQEAYNAGICYKITNYEYKNRSTAGVDLGVRNTKITIIAEKTECKKTEPPKEEKPRTQTTTGGQNPSRIDQPQKKICKHNLKKPNGWITGGEDEINFQNKCIQQGLYYEEYTDGTKKRCGRELADGVWGCCSMSCYSKNSKLYGNPNPFWNTY